MQNVNTLEAMEVARQLILVLKGTVESLQMNLSQERDDNEGLKLTIESLEDENARLQEELFKVQVGAVEEKDTAKKNQAEAIEAIEAAVSLLRERQGVQDPATCGALQNLGRLYLAAGQVEKSIAVSREAVDGLRAGFGEDHPLVAGAMMRLSACLYMQRDLDGAEALLLKARDVFEKQSGDESRMDVSTCLNNLGRIHE
ncbi:MAG: tetratricopeptide repeat protein, partial [Dialister sp.]|nr:tetratricopeptide repeat protein [Dialister sp.]